MSLSKDMKKLASYGTRSGLERGEMIERTIVGWVYELATLYNKETNTYSGWSQPTFSFDKPSTPEGSIRNLYPVFKGER